MPTFYRILQKVCITDCQLGIDFFLKTYVQENYCLEKDYKNYHYFHEIFPLPWKIVNFFPTIFSYVVLWSNCPETHFV